MGRWRSETTIASKILVPGSNPENSWYGASVGGSLCFTSKMYVRQLRLTSHKSKPHKKHNSPNKHHHHGGGAANPSSGVDMMNPRRPRGGRPSLIFFNANIEGFK